MGLLYTLAIYPIESLIEVLYITIHKMFENQGIAIIGLSFAMSVLTFPLYQIAEYLQKRERDCKNLLRPKIERIKAVFSGDERFMILATLYRQHKYHPIYVLRSSLGLLIQVPFFIAAYQFLSHMEALQGSQFLLIADLGVSDQLIKVGNISVNLLPLLMTLCNLFAGFFYTQGFHKSEKIQLYGMSLLFLVVLYQSPAALVLYWTLNNLFSLVKILLTRMSDPWKTLHISASVLSIIGSIVIIVVNPWIVLSKILLLIVVCLCIVFTPWLSKVCKFLFGYFLESLRTRKKDRNILFGLSLFTLLMACGFLIPTNLIASSPIEFSFVGNIDNPLQFVGNTFTIVLGMLGIWIPVLYLLFGDRVKTIFAFIFSTVSLIAYANLFFTNYDVGTINQLLQIEDLERVFPSKNLVFLGLILIVIIMSIVLAVIKFGKTKWLVSLMVIIGMSSLSGGVFNSVKIQKEYSVFKKSVDQQSESTVNIKEDLKPIYTLSRTGKNVFILILDRAVSSYFPMVMEAQPGLRDSYKGFVYYPNTVSSGAYTITGTPPLMAGYEYTPDKMNLRTSERLMDKHNEALVMLPSNFLEAGYAITITDPPLPNYQWEGDLSPFKAYPQMKVAQLEGDYNQVFFNRYPEQLNSLEDASIYIKKYLPRFSLFKVMTPLFKPIVYDEGKYLSTVTFKDRYWRFVKAYSQLYLFNDLTEIVESGNTFTIMHNNTTHEPVFLEAPMYEPKKVLTNTTSPLTGISEATEFDVTMYHVNAAALLKVGEWLDHLKKSGVYDNSRIIILSDHGRDVYTTAFASFSRNQREYAHFNALLLVKDFKANEELKTDMKFMTTSDTPLLALKNLGVSEKNPFTGNKLSEMVDKSSVGMYYTDWNPVKGNKFAFISEKSFFVHDNIFEEENWSPIR